MDIFAHDEQRRAYLQFLAEEARRYGVQFLSWCLMTNHVHFLVIPEKADSLARTFGEAHRRYTRMRNFQEGVRGYLFQGRFGSCVLDENHLLAAVRYVERNPVKAGIVNHTRDYWWSSARFHLGIEATDMLVMDRTLLGLVSDWEDWENLLLDEDDKFSERLRLASRTGRPLGNEDFVGEIERVTGRDPRPKRPGRPRLSG